MLTMSRRRTAAGFTLAILLLLMASKDKADSKDVKDQNLVRSGEAAIVSRVEVILDKDSLAIEVLATRPVRPEIARTLDPPGLRININNARMSIRHRQIPIQSPIIGAMHLEQLTQTPPAVRIVVDERKPVSYTWDAAGNRLTIHLKEKSEEASAKPPSVPALVADPKPVAVPFNTAGVLVYADRQPSGSSFSAKFGTEKLRLSRGGEVHLCPGTTLSMVRQKSGSDLLLAMGVGAMETHYALDDAAADTILTPDFRILLRGPGEFHYAIRADSAGNTCVRSLAGNTAPVVVYEAIGNGQFEVVPTEKLVLHAGHLNATDTAFHSGQQTEVEDILPDDCGCPAPPALLRADASPSPIATGDKTLPTQSEDDSDPPHNQTTQDPTSSSEVSPLRQPAPERIPVKFATALVYSARDAHPPRLVDLPLSARQAPPLGDRAQPPVPAHNAKKKNVLKKLTGFLSRIFR
jgi:AMIN domain